MDECARSFDIHMKLIMETRPLSNFAETGLRLGGRLRAKVVRPERTSHCHHCS